MALKLFAVVCIQMALLNVCLGQVLNRLAPPCSCGLDLPVTGPPLQFFPFSFPPAPAPCPCLPPCSSVLYDQPTTIIQDSTVANNLANALQLLVVSNLLSSTLPLDPPAPLYAPLPAPLYAPLLTQRTPCGCGCGGINPYGCLWS